MSEDLQRYAAAIAADWSLPVIVGQRLAEDMSEAAFDVVDTYWCELHDAVLWPQPCRCDQMQTTADCDYHPPCECHWRIVGSNDDCPRHGRVKGAEWPRYAPTREDANGLRWPMSARTKSPVDA